MSKYTSEFIKAAEKFASNVDKMPVDVWTGITGFATTSDGKFSALGGTHERMTWGEYRKRLPDEDCCE